MTAARLEGLKKRQATLSKTPSASASQAGWRMEEEAMPQHVTSVA